MSSAGYRVSPGWDGALGDPRSYGYSYSNTNGSLSSMTLPGGGAYSYTYDGLKRLNSRSLALNNSPFLTREYDYVPGTGANDTTTLVGTLTNKKGNGTTLDGWTYTYDDVGRITSISDGMETWSYTYDVQGQLLTEQKGSGEDYYSASYIYDTAGNIRSKTIEVPGEPEPEPTPTPTPDPTPTPTPDPGGGNGHGGEIIIGTDPLDPILPTPTPDAGLDSGEQGGNGVQTVTHTKLYTYGNAQWPDLLTAYDGHSISYDASGNPTIWYDGATMSWEHGRQLASVSATNDHAALSFSYDNSGLRLTKTVGTGANAVEHRYTWQGSKLIAEAFGDTELEFFYDESGSPYALLVRDSSTATPTVALFFYVTNLQGDVVMLLDASGNVVAEYSYNAWGEILSSAGTMADVNPIRYRGYYYDAETGLYYLQSRYYDPEIGRFLNADAFASTGQGILGANMFAYCGNEPINNLDSAGLFFVELWYYLFLTSDYGFIHRVVEAHIIAKNPSIASEVPLVRQDGSLGRADLVSKKTKKVWEIKHGAHNAIPAAVQASSYVGGSMYGNKVEGEVSGLGEANAFRGRFAINCLGTTYQVLYYTPMAGVVIYTVSVQQQYDSQPIKVFTPKRVKKESPVLAGSFAFAFGAVLAMGMSSMFTYGGGDYLLRTKE